MRVVMSRGTAQTCWNFEKKKKKLRANANIVEFCLILCYFLWSESHEILGGLKNECLELKHVSRIIIFLDCVLMQKKKSSNHFPAFFIFIYFEKDASVFKWNKKNESTSPKRDGQPCVHSFPNEIELIFILFLLARAIILLLNKQNTDWFRIVPNLSRNHNV